MAAAIGVVSGIASLVALSVQISQLSYNYISDVVNAPRTQKAYLQEVLALSEVLLRLDDAFRDSETIDGSPKRAPAVSEAIVQKCMHQLGMQKVKLEQNRHRLTWPFHERDLKKAVDGMHRYRGIFADCLSASASSVRPKHAFISC